jgi:hypothetical protein
MQISNEQVAATKEKFLDLSNEIAAFANSINKTNYSNAVIKYPGFSVVLKDYIDTLHRLLKL